MAPVDRQTGTSVIVHFLPTGGTPGVDELVLTGDFTAFNESRAVDTVDVTAGSDPNEYVKATIERLDWTITIFDAIQSYQADILPRATGLLTVYKQGVGSGKPVHSYNALIISYNEDYPFDGALEIEVAGKRLGAMEDEVGTVQ